MTRLFSFSNESLSVAGLGGGRTVLRVWERRGGLVAWAMAPVGAALLLPVEAARTSSSLTVGDITTFLPAITPLDPTAGQRGSRESSPRSFTCVLITSVTDPNSIESGSSQKISIRIRIQETLNPDLDPSYFLTLNEIFYNYFISFKIFSSKEVN